MMSMEMSDSSDLLASSRGGFKNYWRSRTVMEQALLVLAVVEGVMLFGFVIGVASLTSEIVSKDAEIHHLAAELEKCLTGNITTFSTMTSTSPTDTDSSISSTLTTSDTSTVVTTPTPTTTDPTTVTTPAPSTTSTASTTVTSSSVSVSTIFSTSGSSIMSSIPLENSYIGDLTNTTNSLNST